MFTQSSKLIDFLQSLTYDQKVLIGKHSFFHPNGFYKIILKVDDNGNTTRLHVWIKNYKQSQQHAHNHGWNFTSHVLYGELLDVHYKKLLTSDTACYGNSHSRNMIEYDDTIVEDKLYGFVPVSDCQLVESLKIKRLQGTTYYLSSDIIHVTQPLIDHTITLIHQYPFKKNAHIFVSKHDVRNRTVNKITKYDSIKVEKIIELFEFVCKTLT